MYGWAFKSDYMLKLARLRRLSFPGFEGFHKILGKKDEYNFGDLTEEQLSNEQLSLPLENIAIQVVLGRFAEKTGLTYYVDRPVSFEWPDMLVLWTNYDVEDRYAWFALLENWEETRNLLDEEMNVCRPEGERMELQWWWSYESIVVGDQCFITYRVALNIPTDIVMLPTRLCGLFIVQACHIS